MPGRAYLDEKRFHMKRWVCGVSVTALCVGLGWLGLGRWASVDAANAAGRVLPAPPDTQPAKKKITVHRAVWL